MIKVQYVVLNYGSVIQDGMYDAIRQAGCELSVFDYFHEFAQNNSDALKTRQKLLTKTLSFHPNLLLLQIQHTTIIDRETIFEIKKQLPDMIVVNYTQDLRNYLPDTYRSIGTVSDYNLIPSTGQLEIYKQQINNVKYWQIGYNPALYYPENPSRTNFDFDVVFVANDNPNENYPGRHDRIQLIRTLRQNFGSRFGLFGSNWPADMGALYSADQRKLASEVYWKSVCCLSVSHYNDISHYFSDRLLMCLASGRPTVCYRFPNWESYFTHNSDLVIANSYEDVVLAVRKLKENVEYANFIGENGALKAFGEHTYASRFVELLGMVRLDKH